MIELPEAIILGRQLEEKLTGKSVTDVFNATTPHRGTFFNGDPKEYKQILTGEQVLSVKGYGIFVGIKMSNGKIIYIGDGVSVKYGDALSKIPAKYQLLLTFDDNSFLAFSVGLYGMIYAVGEDFENKYVSLSRDSISPVSDKYDLTEFNKLFTEEKKNISAKELLATGQRIPGIGNGALQDILFNAGINPRKKKDTFTDNDKQKLLQAVKTTLNNMIAGEGRDTQTDIYGQKGKYKTILSSKTWKNPCPVCGGQIVKENFMGGVIYYCPVCQPI